MKYIDDINLFKSNKDFVAEIDMTGSLGRIYHYPQRMEGCLFLLCLRGECDITIHLSEHKIQTTLSLFCQKPLYMFTGKVPTVVCT
jgi:AraC family transcriptional activator of pobA